MKIKTIDIQAKEWNDRVNGNSYFSAQIILNYGMKNSKTLYLPFQYGYDDHYKDMAFKKLQDDKAITSEKEIGRYWEYCNDNGIILRTNITRGCKKRDVIAYGFDPEA